MNETGHEHAAAAAPAKAACCRGHGDHGAQAHHHHDRAAAAATVKDPVCGMNVDPATSKHRFAHRGATFHFCSARCREKFAADPAKYLDRREPPPAAPAGTIYTCPMHPEIRQV